LVPGHSGRGLGSALLAAGESWLARSQPKVKALVAQVRDDNEVSIRLFESAGFERSHTVFRKEVCRHD
jgi:RimJ/RimL family protein N-acetyltransferase